MPSLPSCGRSDRGTSDRRRPVLGPRSRSKRRPAHRGGLPGGRASGRDSDRRPGHNGAGRGCCRRGADRCCRFSGRCAGLRVVGCAGVDRRVGDHRLPGAGLDLGGQRVRRRRGWLPARCRDGLHAGAMRCDGPEQRDALLLQGRGGQCRWHGVVLDRIGGRDARSRDEPRRHPEQRGWNERVRRAEVRLWCRPVPGDALQLGDDPAGERGPTVWRHRDRDGPLAECHAL